MSRKILIMAAVLLVYSAQQAFCASEPEKAPETMKEHTFRDFQIRIYSNDETGQGRLEILKKGRRIYERQSEGSFYVGLIYQDKYIGYAKDFVKEHKVHPKDAYESVAIGKDMTGRGIPNLVISESTGGAHCCYKFYVFELDEKIRTIVVLDALHGDLSHFVDLDNDNIPEFIAWDWTFAYWNASFASSPAPRIILRFDKDKYVLAEKLMRKPAPSAEELEAKAQDVHKVQAEYSSELSKNTSKTPESYRACFPSHEYSPILWETMLDLIYTGNMDAAWKFFDKAWVKGVKGKDKFLREFREQLKTSPYWSEIEKMNTIK